MDPIEVGQWSLHPVHLLTWFVILVWAVCTLFLADYYLTANQIVSAHLWDFAPSAAHARVSPEDATALGLGLSHSLTVEQSEQSLSRLMALRAAQKEGNGTRLAGETTSLRTWVAGLNNEAAKAAWAPVLSCAQSGCDNPTYLRAAGELASEQPLLASHAMALEAFNWYLAHDAGDPVGSARAIASLDLLARHYGRADLSVRWDQLQACSTTCPLFEEQLLDFVTEASKL